MEEVGVGVGVGGDTPWITVCGRMATCGSLTLLPSPDAEEDAQLSVNSFLDNAATSCVSLGSSVSPSRCCKIGKCKYETDVDTPLAELDLECSDLKSGVATDCSEYPCRGSCDIVRPAPPRPPVVCSSSRCPGCSDSPCCCDLIPGLPDDVAVLVLARLSRRCLRSVRLVSKCCKRAVENVEFIQTRKKLRIQEAWVYVESWNSVTKILSWYSLVPVGNKWLLLPPIPRKRSLSPEVFGAEALSFNGQLWMFGGKVGDVGPTLRDVYIFSPLSNLWNRGKSMINARHSPYVFTTGGRIFVLGGFDCSNNRLNSSECYDPVTDEWTCQSIENYPEVFPPSGYHKGWQLPWIPIPLNNGNLYLSYKTYNSAPQRCKMFTPGGSSWIEKPHHAKALVRYGLSAMIDDHFVTIDWAGGKVRIADSNCYRWLYPKGLSLEDLPWVSILTANPRMTGIGKRLYIFTRGLTVLIIDLQENISGGASYGHCKIPSQKGMEDEEILRCTTVAV